MNNRDRRFMTVWGGLIVIGLLSNISLAFVLSLLNFDAPRHFSNGSTTVYTASADFNKDGNADIAATAHDASYVGVFIGDGTGNFSGPTVLPAGSFSVPVATGDFNNDANQDLVVGSSDGTVWIYLGNGSGGFGTATQYADGGGEDYGIAVDDFDHDGNLDFAVGLDGVAIMMGDGTGAFTHLVTHNLGGIALVENTDFNNDGDVDLIAFNHYGTNPWIMLGDGNGGFSVSVSTIENRNYALGDFDGDGNVDVATPNGVYRGNGDGSFGSPTSYPGPNGAIKAGDLNGDGNLDIAVAEGNPLNTVSVMVGDGSGGFGQPIAFPTGDHPTDLRFADFNNDGKLDMVTANYFGADITVLLNSTFELVGPPTDKNQCKYGGWQIFNTPRTFSNQGDCVSFVNTGH